jgi:hypothetical protein
MMDGKEYRLVKVSVGAGHRKMKADFAAVEAETAPMLNGVSQIERERSRKTSDRDLLKALSAFRLLRHFKETGREAAEFTALLCVDRRGKPGTCSLRRASEWICKEAKAERTYTESFQQRFLVIHPTTDTASLSCVI